MIKTLTAALALTALASLATAAEPTKMSDAALDQVVAGWVDNCSDGLCGNNGWGNGPDSTNPGSDAGLTALTKSDNGVNAPSGNGVNLNPVIDRGGR